MFTSRVGSIVLAWPLFLMHLLALPATGQQTDTRSQEQIQSSNILPAANEPTSKSQVTFSTRTQSKGKAWQTLETACAENKVAERASATLILGLLRNDTKARKLAEKALTDPKPEVRSAAAGALGEMGARKSIPKLRKALDDNDGSVALAAAHALHLMHDASAYEVYYQVLTRQRRSGRGLISSQVSTLSDPKKMAQLGFEEGIGFVPFAGIGWKAIKEVRKDDSSPVRAASARVLAEDPDPATTKVLADEAGDKSWIVRAAALEALAKRGDPSALHTVELHMQDEKDLVRYTAAAATLRLLAIKEAKHSARERQAENGSSVR
jgi:HEAT repeats